MDVTSLCAKVQTHKKSWSFWRSARFLVKGEQFCPRELSSVMEMVYVCAVQYNSHLPHVAIGYLKKAGATELNFNFISS